MTRTERDKLALRAFVGDVELRDAQLDAVGRQVKDRLIGMMRELAEEDEARNANRR